MLKNIFFASLIGGLIGLDRTAIFQTMISQPIVTAPVIGFIFGNYQAGILIGIALQLIWLFSLQIGAAIVLNSTLASVIVTVSTIEILNTMGSGNETLRTVASLSFLLCIPFLFVEQKMDMFARKANVFWVKKAEDLIEKGDFSGIGLANLSGNLFFYLKNFLFLFLSGAIITVILKRSYPLLPGNFIAGLDLFFKLIPLLGIAVVFESILVKRNYIYFFVGLFIIILFKLVLKNI